MTPSKAHDTAYYYQTLKIIRANGILLPFVVAAAGFLVKLNVISQASYVHDGWFVGITSGFVLLAVVYYSRTALSPRAYFGFSVAYHIMAVLFLVCISGVASPFIVLWVVLFMGLDNYFGGRSLLFSMSMLALAGILNIIIHPDLDRHERMAVALTVLFTIAVCTTISKLRSVNDRERVDLASSHDREAFERDRLITLVNSLSDSVISVNEKGIIKVFNSAALGLLDIHSLENKQFNRYVKVYNEAGRRIDILAHARRSETGFARDDLHLIYDGGETTSLSVSISPIQLSYHTKGEHGFICILRDITKQKTLEQERDEFISVVSHELRTPVAIAEGNISNIRLLRSKGLPEATVNRALDETHEQIMYLAKMINDLSTLSRAERGLDAEAERLPLNEMLGNLYRKYEPKASEKSLHLNLDVPGTLPTVTTSRLYLEEILQNFITNAIKYTKAGSITLHAAQADDTVSISVADTGIGISKSDQKRIFEKFYRSEDYRTRESNGTGLGLYLSQKLADKLGASITFESRLNHGSVFTLSLPVEDAAETKKPAA